MAIGEAVLADILFLLTPLYSTQSLSFILASFTDGTQSYYDNGTYESLITKRMLHSFHDLS